MSGQTTAKIRLVRCPKCRQILPELPDVPVYECGGCGTRLQAKVRKENSQSTTSGLPETTAAETNRMDHISEDKGSSSSSQSIVRSAGECSLNQNNGNDQIESNSCQGDKLAGVDLPNEDENNVNDRSGSEKIEAEQLENVNLSNDDPKSESDQNESGACEDEQVMGDVNISSEDHNCSHISESSTCNVELLGISNKDCLSNGLSNLVSGELPHFPLTGTNSEVEGNDRSSPLASKVEAEGEVDANRESGSIFIRSSQEELIHTDGSASFATAHWLAGESISSDILVSPPNELLQQPQEGARYCLDRVRSTDTFETTDFVTPSSELSGTLIDLSKSPTTRSSRAYYDDSVSSYEGTDDRLPDRHKSSSKHAYRLTNNAASDVRTKRERFQANSNYDMQNHVRNSASMQPGKTHYSRKWSNLDRDELLEPTRIDHLVRNWRREERDEYLSQRQERDKYLSQRLLHQREPLACYGSGSPSSQLDNDFFYSSSFASLDKPAYTEQEEIKLLRMVYELQEQLNSTSRSHKANGGVTWKDDQIPMYYDHEIWHQESLQNRYIPRYPGKLREGSNWRQQRKYSRIPFSAEATTSRHQVDHFLCSCPQDWQQSAQFALPLLRHNKGPCHVHSRTNLYNSFGSCPSSPQRHVDSEFLTYNREVNSDDQRHGNREVKRYLREKPQLTKRHLRPIAGGAPLITCPCCLKQLQLPADFLLSKRRFHRLRCGNCSEVLKFSLVNRTHLIPYTPATEAPLPSEIDEYNGATHRRNFTSTSHVSDCPCPDSDDFTDRDPVSQTPFHTAQGNSVDRNDSYGSIDGKERRRFVLDDSQSKGKSPVEAYESAGPSTSIYNAKKASSEIEELPASAKGDGGSPLHQLMGYSSPSAVIFGRGPSDPGTISYHPENGLT